MATERTVRTTSVTEVDVDESQRAQELARVRQDFAGADPNDPVIIYDEAVERRGAPQASAEGWIVAIFFAVVYGLIGYFMLTDGRIVNFDSLHRLNEAYMTWWNSPPKLAALTLAAPPLGAVAYVPLAIIKPFATSLTAIPVLTALAAGFLMAIINSILRRCEVPGVFRIIMLLLFGLNPMFVFYAANGEITVLGMVFAAIALLAVISWQLTDETRHLVAAGLAIGAAIMIDYGYALWAVGLAIAVMSIGSGHNDREDRRRSSLILFLTPIIYALLVWILLNAIVLSSPFGWVTAQTGMIQVNTTGALQAVTSSPMDALGDLFSVVLGVAPLGFAAVILLVLSGILVRDGLSWGLFFLIVFSLAVPMTRVLVADQADLMTLSAGLPLALLALAGAAWVYAAEPSWRIGVGIIMVIGLVAAIPLSWDAMKNYEYQDQAQAFTRWVDDQDSQEGTESVGGYQVGIDPEISMAEYINTQLPQVDDSVLVDENFSYGPMITSGRPYIFFDRADKDEGGWEATRDSPFGKVGYMLVSISRAGDQLRQTFPQAVAGGEAGLTPIFKTDRYVLIEVAPTKPRTQEEQGAGGTGNQPQSTPRPITPVTPPTPNNDGPRTSTSATAGTTTDSSGASSGTTPSNSTGTPSSGAGSSTPELEGE
ncbi:MAG: DUF2029 domain-containing protein [Thermoleophilia bacterium]|nr:DUF2029 domain-containing protein [Thermoleophilia bacterium]